MVKRLYDWVLSWGDSRWGALALFVLAFAESSFFPIPPDVLLIALCLGAVTRSFRFAAICLAGSILGAAGGYAIGYYLWQNTAGEYTALANWFFAHVFSEESFLEVKSLYDEYDFWIVFTAGFTPLPYKLFTISGGLFRIDLVMFFVASIVSRGLRFFLIAGLIWKFGAPIKTFIEKYFNLLAILFTVLLIGGFFLIAKVL
ncbi:MAG: DedA family protein [Rikenellaceae bacterium]|nr:DedA family protein [Rikenellaceae bacterium]